MAKPENFMETKNTKTETEERVYSTELERIGELAVRAHNLTKQRADEASWERANAAMGDLQLAIEEYNNNDLMDVWKVSDGTTSYYTDNESDALRCKEADEECGVTELVVTKEKMHREVFENLGEFDGF